jgi:Tol biopolymer transport system component
MSLESGQRLGHYEILEPLGAGGMGEVYRARDTQLDREVAVKVLPRSMAADTTAMARFEREAKAVAALSHPNILSIHDFGSAEGRAYAVTELLDGETLRERLTSGPVPPRKAAELGSQIAQGLGAAHEKGFVHRDLKPENVFVTRDGRAKILDFGLAARPDVQAGDKTETPTRTSLTSPGSVMGTVGYMSPEQVRGEPTDSRSDIFSLGAVLYEMLVGRRAFSRETGAETMTAILREEPPEVSATGVHVPPALAGVVRRCIEKRPEERFHSAHDIAYALELAGSTSSVETAAVPLDLLPSRQAGRTALFVAAAVITGGAFLAGWFLAPARGPGEGPLAAGLVQLTFEAGVEFQPSVAPDGKSFVFVASRGGPSDIYLQRVGGETAINLTEGPVAADFHPTFSPDGELIAFASSRGGGGIFIMGATGESVRRLTDFGFNPAWSPDGATLVVASEAINNPVGRATGSKLWLVDVATGESREIFAGDAVQPSWSPSGRRIAFWGLPAGSGRRVLYTIPAGGGEAVPLNDDGFMNWNPVWSGDGRHLYFSSDRGGRMNIWRLPIDEATGEARGAPEPVSVSTQAVAMFDVVAADGSIVFAASSAKSTVERLAFDAERLAPGTEPEVLLEGSRRLQYFEGSPDGGWLAFNAWDPQEDLLVLDTERRDLRRLTNDPYKDRGPAWSSDSREVFFFSDRGGKYDIWSIRRDGSGLRQVTETSGPNNPIDPLPSPDGKHLIVRLSGSTSVLMDLTGDLPVSESVPLPSQSPDQPFLAGSWSPDGTRVVGMSGESIAVYSLETEKLEIIAEAGLFLPVWHPDGRTVLCGSEEGLVALDAATKERRSIGQFPEGFSGILDAGGHFFYGRASEVEGDIWLLRPET